MGVEDEGSREQNNTVVAKSEDVSMGDVKDDDSLLVPSSKPAGAPEPEVAPEHVEDKGGDTTECSSSFGDTFSGFDDEADGGEPEVTSQIPGPADGDLASMLPRWVFSLNVSCLMVLKSCLMVVLFEEDWICVILF
jgi:hypothetical protein